MAKGIDSLSASILSFIIVGVVFAGAIVIATKASPPKRVVESTEYDEADDGYSTDDVEALKQPESPAGKVEAPIDNKKKN